MTGQLTQKMREAGGEMQNTDFKSVINSILSAVNMQTLTPQDKNDIIKKLKGGGQENNNQDVDETNLQEYDEEIYGNEDVTFGNGDTSRFTASGGQSIGENSINERLDFIINKAKKNVLNEKRK